jgi:hypothetical protein
MAASILDLLNVPHELTLEFLLTFARFEFAHKKAGYALGDNNKVSPDWDSFANDVAQLGAAALPPVLNACQYLQPHSPKKQVLDNGALRWVTRQGTTGSAIVDALLSVRTARNNVFHAGKFPDGMVTAPLRDEQLIRNCLAVLKGLLELPLPKEVANIFKQNMPSTLHRDRVLCLQETPATS